MTGGAIGDVAAQGPNTPFQFLMGLLALPAMREQQAQQAAFGQALAGEMQGTPGQEAIPAAPGGRSAGQPAVEAVPGADFATAINRVLQRDPSMLGRLSSTAFEDPVTLRRLLLGADPTPDQSNLEAFERNYNAGERVPPEIAAQALGVVPETPEKLRIAAGISSILGRDPTESELQRFFGLVNDPSTVVNVGAPDIGPLFSFLDKQQSVKRQDLISKINIASGSINDLLTISSLPNASQLFGPIGKGANLAAPFMEAMGFTQTFGIFGPDIRTLAQAKSRSATALADAARLILAEGGNDVSRREQELAGRVLADPEAFVTSASQVNEAARLFQRRLVTMGTGAAGELSQGGVTPQPGTVNPISDPNVEKRVLKRGAEILQKQGITSETATPEQIDQALDQATKEIIGEPK